MAAAFEPHAIRLHFGPAAPTRIGLVFEGASNGVTIGGEGKRASLFNFFIGNDRSTWRSRVPSYSSVLYRGMYDGIDLRVHDQRERIRHPKRAVNARALKGSRYVRRPT